MSAAKATDAPGLRTRLLALAKLVVPLIITGIAITVLHRFASEITLAEIAADFAAMPATTVAAALLTTACAFCALGSYDVFALRSVAGDRVPAPVALGAGASGYAVSNMLGFSWLTGSAVRYNIYSGFGIEGSVVARVFAYAAIAYWLGLILALGLLLTLHPQGLGDVVPLSGWAETALGIGCLALVAGIFVFLARGPKALKIRRLELALPRPRHAAGMTMAGMAELTTASLTLWILLPEGSAPPFPAFFILYVSAVAMGILAHTPGGLGVFEAVIIAGLGAGGQSETLAALVIYRLIFTVLPFLVAAVSLALAFVLTRRRRKALAATGAPAHGALASASAGIAPPVAAGVVLFSGIVLLVSGNLPIAAPDVTTLRTHLPLSVVEISHLLGSVTGVILTLLPLSMLQRRRGAWIASLVLCALGIVASLAKGLDWVEAGLVLTAMVVLFALRSAYPPRAFSGRPQAMDSTWAARLVGLFAVLTWVGVLAYSAAILEDGVLTSFSWHGDASRFARAAIVAVILVLATLLYALVFRPADEAQSETRG